MMTEKTVVLIKPDGVKRGLVGEILNRFERTGLKAVALKMVWADKPLIEKHYPTHEEYLRDIGRKSLETYEKYGKDPNELLGTKDELAIGKMVRGWFSEYMTEGPVIAILLEGYHAIEQVRNLVGHTLPEMAVPGSIRGDLASDTASLANAKKRAVKNLVHASGSKEEAKFEEELWFHQDEIYEYKRADEDVMF